jgi:DNA-binding transcriptional ArsR family regulator
MDAQASPGASVVSVDAVVAILKAMADQTRFQILWAVVDEERSVRELSEIVEAHVAAVSQHLAKLRAAGLVSSRRDGTRIFYRVANPQVRTVLEGAGVLTDYVRGPRAALRPAYAVDADLDGAGVADGDLEARLVGEERLAVLEHTVDEDLGVARRRDEHVARLSGDLDRQHRRGRPRG